jgi:hypothetical protein
VFADEPNLLARQMLLTLVSNSLPRPIGDPHANSSKASLELSFRTGAPPERTRLSARCQRAIVPCATSPLMPERDLDRNTVVAQLGGSLLARVIMVSNRVAVPSCDRANYAGGLAVAVRSLLKRKGGIWFGWSGTVSADEAVITRTIRQDGLSYIVTNLAAADYQEYNNGFASRVLWPILHYRLDFAEFFRRDLSGYRRVNVHFANQIADWLRSDDVVWVHNYHLIPLAKMLRDRGHRNRIGFFLHVPFPPPEILTALPNHEWLIPQLAAYDLVGFQTERRGALAESSGPGWLPADSQSP